MKLEINIGGNYRPYVPEEWAYPGLAGLNHIVGLVVAPIWVTPPPPHTHHILKKFSAICNRIFQDVIIRVYVGF